MSTSVLVLTEDTGREGAAAFRVLLRRVLDCFERGKEVVRIRPGHSDTYPTVGGNLWRGNTERVSEPRRLLCKGIANALAQGEIVLFHTDGDATWTAGTASIIDEFDGKIRLEVQRFLGYAAEKNGHDPAWVASRLTRLLHVVPTWSIEAWTYQATEKAIELCRTAYGGRDVSRFSTWGSDRGLLDEVEKPKDQVCLGNRHNAELAAGIPLEETIAVRKSFERFVESLRQLGELSERMRC